MTIAPMAPNTPPTEVHLGTRLRDAAVDPRPGDHLAPLGAGRPGPLGNPHGPHVVSPRLDGTAPPTAPANAEGARS